MSIKGFIVNGQTQKYDYEALENKPVIPSGGGGVSDDLKAALLQLAAKVSYSDAHGEDYYQDLYDALYAEPQAQLVSITAVYTQSGVVYNTYSLDSLRSDLVVTGNYDDSTTQAITDYTLSGTLTTGVSLITVSYQGKTTAFTVTVTEAPTLYSITNTLTDCTNSNGDTTIYQGESYSGTLTPIQTGYVVTTVSITMGGTDVTGTAYSNGTISIANVTGNIVITAVATERTATLSSISAVFNQGSNAVYSTDTLDSLKQYLVVTASWSDASISVVSPTDYVLSGTLTVGTSVITVSYGGKTTTFNVIVSEPLTETISWSGTGATKTSSIIDATEHDVYWTMPFVSGATQLVSGATASSTPCKIMDTLIYSDEECTQQVGVYRTDDRTIQSSGRNVTACPAVVFDNQVLVIPRGYYSKLRVDRGSITEAFSSNGNLGSYLNQYATTITLA